MKKKIDELTFTEGVGLMAQLLVSFFMVVFLFMAIGEPKIMNIVDTLLILLFVIMAYNNHFLYKRKRFTLFYIIIAIIILLGKLFS